MKKIFIGILTTVLLLFTGTISTFAAGPKTRWNFVDSNGNPVYNNCGRHYKSCMETIEYGTCFADADKDGICDNYADIDNNNICDNYMDMDQDNICDNCNAFYESCPAGNKCDMNFADTNNDGICDHYAAGQAAGNGYGSHCGGRGNGFRGGRGHNR